MKAINRYKIKKIVKIVLLFFLIALCTVSILSFFIIKSYIRKMDLVSSEEDNQSNIDTDIDSSSIDNIDIGPFHERIIAHNAEAYDVLEDEELIENEDNINQTNDFQKEIDLAEDRIRVNMEENQTPIMDNKEVLNILLIGRDARKENENGRSDAMIIISINKKTRMITATSIMRDIYLHIPGKENNRINAAYSLGGAKLLMETIKQNLKIEINRYASVDFSAFINVIDELGGVNIEISDKEMSLINSSVSSYNENNNLEEAEDQIIESGLKLLNGKQALGYVRIRKIGSDFERTARQRRVLEQIFDKVKSLNLLELNDLANVLLPKITSNLTEGEIFSLLLSLPSYSKYGLQELRIPIEGSYTNMRIRGMAVLNIDFEKNIKEIRNVIYQATALE